MSGLDCEATGGSIVRYCCFKHDMGALSQLNMETLETLPTPLLGRCKSALPMGAFLQDHGSYM